MKKIIGLLFLGFFLITASGCVTVFSEFQSARTLGEGNKEITGNISGVSYAGEGEASYHQTNLGLQFGMGINELADLRIRIENMNLNNESSENFKYYAVGIGPKISVVENKLAVYAPLGFAFGGDLETDETFEIQPTLLYSIPVSEDLEINTSGKYIFTFEEDRNNSIAFNLGLGYIDEALTFRPEIGVMIYPDDTGFIFFHFGTGLSYNF